jgi:hypothetical protein
MRQLATSTAGLIARAHPEDRSLHSALKKAQERLHDQDTWSFEPGGLLGIKSHSRKTMTHVTDGQTCDCETRPPNWCWHKAAHLILFVLATVCGVGPDEDGRLSIRFPPEEDEGT